MTDKNNQRLRFISLEKASAPFDGAVVMMNRWWNVCPERGLIFWTDRMISQCNSQKAVTDHFIKNIYPWAEAKFIEVVYVKSEKIDYRDLR